MSALEAPLVACDCCEAIDEVTPETIDNAPSLDAIAYRIGTHATFLESMRSQLSRNPLLAGLTTRQPDDPTMSLLDAWATALDVLTFYQERIANEGYLRTATERLSIRLLASSIGYRLGGGVAAGTWLAFTLETAAPSPQRVEIAVGTKVQSLPGQDEKPQIFETVEAIEARPEWNAIAAAVSEPWTVSFGASELFLDGVSTGLVQGDVLVIVGDERRNNAGSEAWDVRRIKSVRTNRERGYTHVTFAPGLGSSDPYSAPAAVNPTVYAMRQRAALYGSNAPMYKPMPAEFKTAYGGSGDEWPGFTISDINDEVDAPANAVHLETTYPKIVPGSWVVLSIPTYSELYRVDGITEITPALFTLTTKSTQLTLSGESLTTLFDSALRTTTVFAQSEELAVAERPLTLATQPELLDPVRGDRVLLERFVAGLVEGMRVIVAGRRMRARVLDKKGLTAISADGVEQQLEHDTLVELMASPAALASGGFEWSVQTREGFLGTVFASSTQMEYAASLDDDETAAEVATIAESLGDGDEPTTLRFDAALEGIYDRATVAVMANVAPATHGETKTETLGSGDAAAAFQEFTLRNVPLTYVSAATPSGTASTLEVRVDGILWHEVPSLYGRGPRERVFVTRPDDEGRITVTFGDGITGARLPSGTENVTATYRVGTGVDGEVDAGQLSLLLTRPLGVKAAVGPMAPTGAEDPEVVDDARANAPFTVLTLDRVVSLLDFENFARAFAGIGKAQAEWIWNGSTRLVFVTVAAASGGAVETDSTLMANLRNAIAGATDGLRPFRIGSYTAITFDVNARILVDPDHDADVVLAAIEEALVAEYSFERRAFGEGLGRGEVIALMQRVAGVVAVDLEALHRSAAAASLEVYLPARRARWTSGAIAPAELLLVDRLGITLTEMTS